MRTTAFILLAFLGAASAQEGQPSTQLPSDLRDDAKLAAIVAAYSKGYGKDFGGAARNSTGEIVLRFLGREFIYDDGKKKTFTDLLDRPDIEDTFSQTYPIQNPIDKLPENFDPGRFRVEDLFKALYGSNESEVSHNCETVDFCGHKVKFNARCGAADALRAVGKDLDALLAKNPALKEYVAELGGTFQWRFIAGTKRLSNHSFGNAIDLNVKKSSYWRWDPPSKLSSFTRKDWPTEIIEAFERHGFIWGGKWWHYDTMHFEFRPELIAHARAHPSAPKPGPAGDEKDAKPATKKKDDTLLPLNESER